ncbi:nucleotide triphosphate diphosphatase NUDT15 [Fluviispira multicolorata]|uniref:NUDIX domain-containing protein n=1 Tax=Fluviispira multicolorata TaxID=2654512 RepID=A0A833N1C3_9BACT|nr:NUDIX domain-containing protein [Fluviispira multicolorata]KAB8030695.1 NUDIX domain-containing protein [Fluviispira multicolorata]
MKPGVGIGVIIEKDQKILIGKRIGKHGNGFYSIPGGMLEIGESFLDCAKREIFEETNLQIENAQFFCVTNNIETYINEGVHNISIILYCNSFAGNLKVMEPDKFIDFNWVNIENFADIPLPHFEGSELGIREYLVRKFSL